MSDEKFRFFYGGTFSNWYPCQFEIDGIKYVTTEQHMMAEKARLFGDKDAEATIMKTSDPQKAKIQGRNVKGLKGGKWDKDDIAHWNAHARDIVYKGCYAKFTQNEGMKQELLGTKGMTLVEASPTDQIWGIGWGDDDPEALSRDTWQGSNWLGEVLTKVREDIEAGVFSEDFKWSDGSVSPLPVNIVNETGKELWIWDVDKMKRGASGLANEFSGIKEVTITVEEESGYTNGLLIVGITVLREDGEKFSSHAQSYYRETLDMFRSVLEDVKKELAAA